MKKLLHCIHSLNPQGGGPAQFVKQCALLQKDFEIQIEVVCFDSPSAPWLTEFPCPVHTFEKAAPGYGYSKEFIPWLRNNHQRFDLTIVDGIWQFVSVGTWLALKSDHAPYVVLPHGMLDPWFNQRYPLKALAKQIYWLIAEHQALKNARAVIFTSEEERVRARESFSPYQIKEAVTNYGTLPSPFDLDSSKSLFLSHYPELKQKKILLFLSRLHEKKGCDLLLKAFASLAHKYPEWHLIMAGPTSDYAESLKLQYEQSKQSILWTGMLENEMKWGALSAASALVLPSHQENFARVVSEALSCGTPCLISKRVNIWQEIVNDNAGLAESDNEAGTIALLQKWLSLEDKTQSQMRIDARNCYERRFNMSVTFPQYLKILEGCI